MAKKTSAAERPKPLKRLKKSTNGVKRKTVSAGAFVGQKDEIRRRARAMGMTVSYYINWRLWRDWL